MREKNVKIVGIVAWLTAAFLAGFLLGSEAHAQEGGAVCTDDRKAAVAKLADTYSEARVNIGLAANGSVIEVFATKDGSTFTIALTRPDGLLCMMAAGKNWEAVPFKLPEKGGGT